MAAILLDNIINQTIYNSIFQDSLSRGESQNDISPPPPLLPSLARSPASGGNNSIIAAATEAAATIIRDTASGRLQVEREDRILSSGLNPDGGDQLDSSLTLQNIDMSQYERIFWVILFSIMVLVAAGGNTIVVYIVSTNKEMKSVTNYFLVNLSLADTMVSTLNVVFNFISMLISHWPFGKIYCKISNFIAILSISASVFTLTAISCDRYNAILHPLRPRMSHSHALAWILLIWTLSSALAIPNAIYSNLVEDRLANENVAITCTMIWPDGRYPLSSYDHIYNIIVLVVTYLVPILTMAILYYRVGKELWGYEAIGENIDKQQRSIMAKKKIVKMMIVVVIIFALCWLPYHAFFVVNYYVPTIFQDVPLHYQRCYLIMYWMAMSNSMYNPIIIYFMNSKFRHEFRKILCRFCCCRAYSPPPPPPPPPIRSNNLETNNNNQCNDIKSNNSRTFAQQTKMRHIVQETQQSSKILAFQCDNNNNTNNNHHHHHGQEFTKAQENDNIKVRIVVTGRSIGNNGCCCEGNKLSRISETSKQLGDMKIRGCSDQQEREPFMAAAAAAGADLSEHANSNDLNGIIDEKLIDFAHGANVTKQSAALIDSSKLKVWI